MIKKYSSQFALALVLMMASISCNWIGGNRGNMVIKGTFTKFPGKKITLMEVDLRKTIPIDTVNLDEEGEFRFRFDRDSAGIYLLKVDNRNFITLVLDEEETVEVYSDRDLIQSGYLVEGSEISRKLAEYESALQRNKDIVDSLVLKYNQGQARFNQSSLQLRMDEKYQETFEDQVELSRRFIQDNCGSLAALLVLEKRFGMRKILDEEKEGEYYIMVDSCLKEKYPGNKHQLDFSERIQYIKQRKAIQDHRDRMLSLGSKVPDITLEDPKGKSISLYSFSGNKVILYFWASWDKKSRSSNQEMKRVYELYHPKGLKIYAVSLESYRDTWESAIRADALPWTNVTDYLNIQSGAVSLFNVPDEFPYFFLLNENMEILYKGSSFVRLLEQLESSMN